MRTYRNPGSAGFEEALESEIYVDKTGMLSHLNALLGTRQKYVSVSRPRRFGKTTAADMVCAYYDRTADSLSSRGRWLPGARRSARPGERSHGTDTLAAST